MTLLRHQRLAGAGLAAFALVEFGVIINAAFEVRKLLSDMHYKDPQILFLCLPIVGFTIGFAVIASQLFGGIKMIFSTRPVPLWGLISSIIAITTLWGLPVGIYGVWTQVAFNKSKT